MNQRISAGTLCFLAVAFSSFAAHARTDSCYRGGPLLPNYTLEGNATLNGMNISVTADLPNQNAAVMFNPKFSTAADIHLKLVFRITTTTSAGADGWAFVLHNDARAAGAIGSPGEGIGYGESNAQLGMTKISPSVVVEFDTFKNGNRNDPTDNHIALTLDGFPTHNSGTNTGLPVVDLTATSTMVLKSNTTMYAWLDYTAANTTLEVYLATSDTKPATSLLKTTSINLTRLGDTFWMGFTGSTGTQQSKHEVLEFYATDGVTDPESVCCETDDPDCVGSPLGPVCAAHKHICGECTILDVSHCPEQPAGCDLSDYYNKCMAPCDGNYGAGTPHACPSSYFPVCRTAGPGTGSCFVCDGDEGTGTAHPCESGAPFCSNTGYCGFCSTNEDCASAGATHSGDVCNSTTGHCVASCTQDSDCGPGNWCHANVCRAKLENGELLPGNCATLGARGCITGVCENSDNRCGYLNAPASTGSCAGGNAQRCRSNKCDPHDGLCGLADGNGVCAVASQATDCRSGECHPTTHVCGHSDGKPCSPGTHCFSGHCVDGVCCDTACGGACDRCNLAGSVGDCSFLPEGSTGSPSCAPYLCSGEAATCPSGCTDEEGCITGHFCDGSTCKPEQDDGTGCSRDEQCQSGHCTDGVCCDKACADACDQCNLPGSVGVCTLAPAGSAGSPSCSPNTCNGTSAECPNGCNGGQGCGAGFYCDGTNCQPKKDDGETCAEGRECTNGNCADGVCCNQACTGQCEACDGAGSLGQCKPVTGAPHGARAACATDGSSCAGSCDGTVREACTFPGVDVECLSAVCRNNVAYSAGFCDGAGGCGQSTEQDCGAYRCVQTTCLTHCDDNSDCIGGYTCIESRCERVDMGTAPVAPGCGCGAPGGPMWFAGFAVLAVLRRKRTGPIAG